jgi:hypothetical protein
MGKFVSVVKHEIQKGLLPAFFFFLVFYILAVTKSLMLSSAELSVTELTIALVGALIVTKAILVTDMLPFANLFASKPLYFGILWKTVLYGIFVFLFRLAEELITIWSRTGEFFGTLENFMTEVSWPHFFAILIWVLLALTFYNVVMALDAHFGSGSIRRGLFGKNEISPEQ